MGCVNGQMGKNIMAKYFNILKTNQRLYGKFYIGLIDDSNRNDFYNSIAKNTGEYYYWGDYEIAIKNVKTNNNIVNRSKNKNTE